MISLFGFSYCDSCVFCMKQEVNLKEILLIVLFNINVFTLEEKETLVAV